MEKLQLHQEYKLYEKSGKIFCDSLQVAESFEKRHNNVLRDIKNTLKDTSESFGLLNFEPSYYKDGQNKKQPRYLMTKDGFLILVMGYKSKKAMTFKESYINRFNQMKAYIELQRDLTKELHPALTAALKETCERAGKDSPSHIYSNELNMLYRIVLGMDAKTFRKENGLQEREIIKPYLTAPQLKSLERLQRINIGLLEAGLTFDERKAKLTTANIYYLLRHLLKNHNQH